MAWTDHDTPAEFFGGEYALASNEVKFSTTTKAGTTVGTTFQGEADDNVITTAAAHGLVVGDRVQVTAGTTLPTGLAATTNYWVKTVPTTTTFTLSSNPSLTNTVALGTDGSADNTVARMGFLQEVTDAEANASTGDARKVLFGLIDEFYKRYNAIPSGERPAKMTISRSSSENSNGTFNRTYVFNFTLDATGFEVASE